MPTTPTPATRTPTTPTPRRRSRAALARCLDPVGAETFLAEHWEQRPLVVPRAEPGRFDDLLSEADVERLVCGTAIRYPGFRLVREGSQIAVGAYTSDVSWRPPFTGTAEVPRVLAEWDAGATIVLQALHVNWHPLAVFCRLLEDALGRGVQANAYYTPSGSQGFGVHHDTHDVLVLQVAGEKRWKLYDPLLELPLKHQRYAAALGEHGPPTDDLGLRAGDTLYLPRGWLHEAETSEVDSLHLTIGVAAHTWHDAASAALATLEDEPAFRGDVARGKGDGLAELLAERLDPGLAERRRRRRFVQTRRPIREDGLSQLRALERLDTATPLERRETVIADLDEDGDGFALVFEGKEIRFPRHAGPELRACFEAEEPFRPDALPGELDAEGRLVLVRRLVREGFLRVVLDEGAGPSSSGLAGQPTTAWAVTW
ncbi:MAG: cupin domain-containing protein [Gaiella sp.]|nr:cupin domain-containing protein [Gaiella sp.]